MAFILFSGGKKCPPNIQRMRADNLLAAVFPEQQACPENLAAGDIDIPNHPLIREVMKDVLTEAMDIEGLERVLGGIAVGEIKCLAVDTPIASQFSHEILNANPYAYLDDAPLEERRARLARVRDAAYWVASERVSAFMQIFPSASFETHVPHVEWQELSREEALLACVTGWIAHGGPITATQLSTALAVSVPDIEKSLLRLESRGGVLRR